MVYTRYMNIKIKDKKELIAILKDNGIDFSKWGAGEAKTIDNLWNEISNGETVIEDDFRKQGLIRTIKVVAADVYSRNRTYILEEYKQVFSDGRKRKRNLSTSVSEKMFTYEYGMLEEALKRMLKEELDISVKDNYKYKLNMAYPKTNESESYPGLDSAKYLYVFDVDLEEYEEEYTEVQKDKTTYFRWRPV